MLRKSGRRKLPSSCVKCAGLAALVAAGAAGAQTQGLRIEPSASVAVTVTDNYRLSTTSRQAEIVTRLSPGLRVSSQSGRVRGYADYTLDGVVYARNSQDNDVQHRLSAVVTGEVVENWAFVDANASVSRQAVSAFGSLSPDDRLANPNSAQVATWQISPYVRGSLGGLADYEARLSHAATRSDRGNTFDSDNSAASLRLSNRSGRISWSADLSRQIYDFSASGETTADRLRLQAGYAVSPQLVLSLIGGQETNDFLGTGSQTRDNVGWGLDWRPSERTRVSASQERRFFGTGHNVVLEHRMQRTVVSFTDSRDVSSPLDQLRTAPLGTAYDLFFAQFASVEPDPVRRQILVNNFLLANGIAPGTPIVGGFLTSAVTVQRTQQLAFAWRGLRNTLTVTVFRQHGERAESALTVGDDFDVTNAIDQRGLSLGVSHRLTPHSALNFTGSLTRSRGDLASQSTTLRSLQLVWTSRLGEQTTGSLGLRHANFSSATQPYTESALTGTLSVRF